MINDRMDVNDWLRKQLESADPDLLREMVHSFAETLMSADADETCGAPYGVVSAERVNRRNGYRTRRWDTRVGTIDLRIPKLREGTISPTGFSMRGPGPSGPLSNVSPKPMSGGFPRGGSRGWWKPLGIASLSKSQVSEIAKDLDEMVDDFRNRPLDRAPYTYVWADALTMKVREGGRVANVALLHAVGVNGDGHREILGLEITTTEDGAGWLSFWRGLVARGLSGVQLVVSDDHTGLVEAIRATLPGASWQRCRTHYMRNLLTKVPKAAQQMVATIVRTIFAQPDPDTVWAQHRRVVDQLQGAGFAEAAEHLDEAAADLLAFTGFPKQHWRQVWSNNPQERLNREIRRRTDVVEIFPTRASVIRLVGAVMAEQDDEWAIARRYMSHESLAQARIRSLDPPDPQLDGKELTPAAIEQAS